MNKYDQTLNSHNFVLRCPTQMVRPSTSYAFFKEKIPVPVDINQEIPMMTSRRILTNLLCLSRHLASYPANGGGGGHGVISIYGRAVNKGARCLNTMSIFDGSEERNPQIRSRPSHYIFPWFNFS